MPLIFDGIARFTIVGSVWGEDCMNILDVEVDTEAPTTREEAMFGIAGDILNNWSDHILPVLSAGYEAREVRWVDLNSASGSTGSRTETSEETWPAPGETVGQALPGNVYVKVSKILEGKNRLQRNGTLRLGGIPESYTSGGNGNVLEPTQQAGINAAFESFKDGINGSDVGGRTTNIGVLHTVDQVATGFSVMSVFSVQSVVGTIRRRMPGYGS